MRVLHSRVWFCEIFVSMILNRYVTSHNVNVFLFVAYLIKATTVVSSAKKKLKQENKNIPFTSLLP